MTVLFPEEILPVEMGISTAENKENQGQSFFAASESKPVNTYICI